MRHPVKPKCKHKCRFLQITDELWLCPHAAYGAATDLAGAVEEGRLLLDQAGGYDAVLARIQQREEEALAAARMRREAKSQRLADTLKYR